MISRTPSPKLPDAYIWQLERARYHLKLIQAFISKAGRKTSINDADWGDFVTLWHVVTDLENITEFLGIDSDAEE